MQTVGFGTYLIRAPFGSDLRLDQWRALKDLKARGKARSIGASNSDESHLDEIKDAGPADVRCQSDRIASWSRKAELLAYMSQHNIAPDCIQQPRAALDVACRGRSGQRQDRRYESRRHRVQSEDREIRRVRGTAFAAFPDNDTYLDQDTVFDVRDDLVMTYEEKLPPEFPIGIVLSGNVNEPILKVKFDIVLAGD